MSLPPMEKGTRSPAELSGEEDKGYHDRDRVEAAEAPKEEPDRDEESETAPSKPVASPTDCVLKIKSPGPETEAQIDRNDCAQDEVDSPASSSRTPLSPQYRHILPEPQPQPWTHREPQYSEHQYSEAQYYRQGPAPPWHQPPLDTHHYSGGGGEHEQHTNVRLPSIAALLTQPYTPQPMARMAGYSDRPVEWAPSPPPAPEHYPPMVAALPLDDTRPRTPQSMPQRKRGRLPKETTDFLKAWLHSHSAHPYPSEIEKKQMCHATGLSMSQVSNWMINGRRRILGPSYLSTSRSSSNPHGSPPVTLSSPPVTLSSPSVMLSSPSLMLQSPSGGPPS